MSEEAVCCIECGSVIRDNSEQTFEGSTYCVDCYQANLAGCDECGFITPSDELWAYHWKFICDSCNEEHYSTCCCCGASYDRDWQERIGAAWGEMCSSCSTDHFICESRRGTDIYQ